MSYGIFLAGKDCGSDDNYAFSFVVKEYSQGDAPVPVPAKFVQTEQLTSGLIGITDYGAMFVNYNSIPDGFDDTELVITAIVLDADDTDVTATVGLTTLIEEATVGSQIGN